MPDRALLGSHSGLVPGIRRYDHCAAAASRDRFRRGLKQAVGQKRDAGGGADLVGPTELVAKRRQGGSLRGCQEGGLSKGPRRFALARSRVYSRFSPPKRPS